MEQHENSGETDQAFVGNIDCNISISNDTPITIKLTSQNAKCTLSFVTGRVGHIFFWHLDPCNILLATSTYGNM
jgi:hypothetical protein